MIDRAREEARGLGADYVGTEHLLLALLSDGGVAGAALARSAWTSTRCASEPGPCARRCRPWGGRG